MKTTTQVLEELREEIHEQFTKYDDYCSGLGKALGMVENKLMEAKCEMADSPREVSLQIPAEVGKYAQMMKLLKAGKKVKIEHKCYTGLQIPTIKLTNELGVTKTLDLKCCESHKFESYEIPPFEGVTEISVVGYGITSRCDKIEYIYANPQMNRLFAHLEDGRDVDYDFNILDVAYQSSVEEYEEPQEMREVNLEFFKVAEGNGHRKYYATEKRQYPSTWRVDEIVDEVEKNEKSYRGMDVYLRFNSDDDIGFPCFILASDRKYGGEEHV